MDTRTVLFASALCFLGVASPAQGEMTSSELLAKLKAAYGTAKTLEVSVSSNTAGQKASARISYQRPGRLRVSGTTLFGTPFQLLVNDDVTWVFSNDAWTKAESVEMGIATITGISGSTGTLVPSILFGTSWGMPDPAFTKASKVSQVSLDGRTAYRVISATPNKVTYWVDSKTFLVTKARTEFGDMKIDVEFSGYKLNLPIAATVFRKGTK
jgi:outer membrane lipoprotein-sorting protein